MQPYMGFRWDRGRYMGKYPHALLQPVMYTCRSLTDKRLGVCKASAAALCPMLIDAALEDSAASYQLQRSRRFAFIPMASATPSQSTHLPTGYLFHELYFWHNAGYLQSLSKRVEAWRHWENPETKRRCCCSALPTLHNTYRIGLSQAKWGKLVQVSQLAGGKRSPRPLAPPAAPASHGPGACQVGRGPGAWTRS